MSEPFERALLYLTDLRFQVRHSAEAKAIVDRCLALLMASREAGPDDLATLESEFEAVRAELVRQFGVKSPQRVL